jgi:plastocyanin
MLTILALPVAALAADVTVNDDSYDPVATKIRAGATVTWHWATSLLGSPLGSSVTADSGAFDSGARGNGATFSYTFNTAGTYGYHDSASSAQTGTVTAYGAPSVSLTPATSTIARGQSVTFQASADTDPPGGSLTYDWDLNGDGTYEVAGGTSQTVAFPDAGSFTVGVRVTDEVGNQSTASASVQVNVPDTDGDGINDDLDRCPTAAGVAPDGCPLKSSLVAADELGLPRALNSGAAALLSCSAPCTGYFTLSRNGRSVASPLTAFLPSGGSKLVSEPDRLDGWLQAARADGIRPLVSFQHARGMTCPGKHCKGPSKGQFTRAWKAFHKKYPWVKDISPWNEVNSATQPTGKRPDLAAAYYNVVRANCRGCTIIAADLLDATNIRRYVASFLAKAKGKPRLWGLHNYTDTNRFRSRGTKALLETVKGNVWLTETGGVVRFVTSKGVVALPKSESRAKKAMDYMFRLAEANARRIKRIYVYQWKANNPFDRFDAGVVRPDGTPRPSFDVLSVNASIARKR